jgi:predicted aminopeptidase
MFRFIRILLLCVLIVVTLVGILHYRLVLYGWGQLRGQLHIIYHAKPVEEYLSDPSYPDSLKKKLAFIRDVRTYATDSLGLKDSRNYTTLYDQQGKPALWVITACSPYELKAYEWEFPFLGNVSYKGYFDKEKGLPEVEALRAEGYDVDYHPTGGWSTLGWFRDPILSNMLRKNEGQLAELIIHELSHATLYLPGSVDYNENFATFIGEQGALRYLRHRYGTSSLEYVRYQYEQEDEARFGSYMLQSSLRLDSLYKTIPGTADSSAKRKIKTEFIKGITQNISNLNLHYPDRYPRYTTDQKLPNNCYFMTYRRYRKSQEKFKKELEQNNGNMQLWINKLVREVGG